MPSHLRRPLLSTEAPDTAEASELLTLSPGIKTWLSSPTQHKKLERHASEASVDNKNLYSSDTELYRTYLERIRETQMTKQTKRNWSKSLQTVCFYPPSHDRHGANRQPKIEETSGQGEADLLGILFSGFHQHLYVEICGVWR